MEAPIVRKGDTSGVYRDSFALSDMYERNLDYVVGSEDEDTKETTEQVTEQP